MPSTKYYLIMHMFEQMSEQLNRWMNKEIKFGKFIKHFSLYYSELNIRNLYKKGLS